ncbi:MAG: FAD-binding protein [Agathobacter sp.]|nr:FAD-binding protein [Agathobacter sp.]
MKNYDVIIVGGGAGGLFAAYEFTKVAPQLRVCILEKGNRLEKRKCPIDGDKIKNCIHCKDCSIMTGIGGAGAFSDGKYNITNDFGGNLHEYVGKEKAIELMEYVDSINMAMGGEGTKLYPSASSDLKRRALQYDLHILDANVRHLGTEKNYFIIQNIVKYLEDKVDIYYNHTVIDIQQNDDHWIVKSDNGDFGSEYVIVATGRSGSKWTSELCKNLGLEDSNNRVDIGVRFECPAEGWEPITDEVYESKIMYRSPNTGCTCRTFCMNPHGSVVAENTNGIVTVNGHSYEDPKLHTKNTNFALLVTHHFTEPFKDSNAYGEAIASLVNMLAGGVMVQRFGDLVANKRTNDKRLNESFVVPTLSATPGNLALAIPKMTLDTIIDMIYALDKLVPSTANYDSLLYGAEIKFYNSVVKVDENLESKYEGLFFIGDCSGTTHSLSQASAEGVHVARIIGTRN